MSTDTPWHCIAFTRTCGWEERDRRDDDLTTFGGVVAWARRRGLVSPQVAARLDDRAKASPEEAEETLRDAVRLRGAVYRVLRAHAEARDPGEEDMDVLNDWVARAGARRALTRQGATYAWTWEREDPPHPHRVLWPVALSTAELLTGEKAPRIRSCDGDGCGWLFIDESRNRSRRWCDMSDCGNRAKVRRYRARHADE